jgi:hypothetical protein
MCCWGWIAGWVLWVVAQCSLYDQMAAVLLLSDVAGADELMMCATWPSNDCQ